MFTSIVRRVPIALVVAIAFGGGQPARADGPKPDRRPDVLFVVVDDLRCSLGCYGVAEVRSPNIDRLAAKGVRFDRAYVQYPVCNPSRTSFLTGLRPDTTTILDNKVPFRRVMPDVVTLPQLFRQAGYETAGLGKVIHQGLDDRGRMVFHQDPKSWGTCLDGKATPLGLRGEGRNLTGGDLAWCRWLSAEGRDEDQPDGQLAAEAVRLLDRDRNGGAPLFLAVGFHKPHDPFIAPKKYFDLYPSGSIALHREPADRTPDLPLSIPNRENFAAFTDRERAEFRRAYYAGTSFVDAQLGKLLEVLDRRSAWDDTILVFLGDHGYHLGEHGWWNKVTVFELCARTPLIVWAPGLAGMGRSTSGIVEFLDIYPTLADLAGLTPPTGLQGTSFKPLLDDSDRPGKPWAYTQVTRGDRMGRSLRTDHWRYTEWEDGKSGVELYDHRSDPLEYQNLAGRDELRAVEEEHRALLREATR